MTLVLSRSDVRMGPLKMGAGGAVLGIVRRRLVTAIGF